MGGTSSLKTDRPAQRGRYLRNPLFLRRKKKKIKREREGCSLLYSKRLTRRRSKGGVNQNPRTRRKNSHTSPKKKRSLEKRPREKKNRTNCYRSGGKLRKGISSFGRKEVQGGGKEENALSGKNSQSWGEEEGKEDSCVKTETSVKKRINRARRLRCIS